MAARIIMRRGVALAAITFMVASLAPISPSSPMSGWIRMCVRKGPLGSVYPRWEYLMGR